jgi:hypothetical protein
MQLGEFDATAVGVILFELRMSPAIRWPALPAVIQPGFLQTDRITAGE